MFLKCSVLFGYGTFLIISLRLHVLKAAISSAAAEDNNSRSVSSAEESKIHCHRIVLSCISVDTDTSDGVMHPHNALTLLKIKLWSIVVVFLLSVIIIQSVKHCR